MTKDELDTAIDFYADHVGKGGMSFINDATVVSTLALLQELKKLRHPEPAADCPHCREVYEIWANTEGFVPVTAPEGYQQQVMNQMRDAAARGLSPNRNGDA